MIALNRGDAASRDPLSRTRGGGRAGSGADLVQSLPGLRSGRRPGARHGEPGSCAGDRSLLRARRADEGGRCWTGWGGAPNRWRCIARSSPSARTPTACPSRRAGARARARARSRPTTTGAPPPWRGRWPSVHAAYPGRGFPPGRAYVEQRTGRRKVYVQQPVSGHFPYLPGASNSFARDHFPWLAALEAKTAEIRRELLSLLEEGDAGLPPLYRLRSDPAGQSMGGAQP